MTKNIFPPLIATALALLPSIVTAVPALTFFEEKAHRQTGKKSSVFLGGDWVVDMRDGVVFVGCGPEGDSFPPSLFCPLGATGFITFGDFDGDGLPDAGQWWEVTQAPIRASQVEIDRPDQISMYGVSSPTLAELLRKGNGDITKIFTPRDTGVRVFYTFPAGPIGEYTVSGYNMDRPYGEVPISNQWVDLSGDTYFGDLIPDLADVMLNPPAPDPLNAPDIADGDPMLRIDTIISGSGILDFDFQVTEADRLLAVPDYMESELQRQYDELWWGPHKFLYPALTGVFQNAPEGTLRLYGVDVAISPDVYPGRSPSPSGWRIVNDWFEGAIEIDPRTRYLIDWVGIDPSNAFLGDELHFGIRANQWLDVDGVTRQTIEDPSLVEAPLGFLPDVLVFPPFPITTTPGPPIRQPVQVNIFSEEYNLPPLIYKPGDSGIGELDFFRSASAGNYSTQVTNRSIEFPIRFIDTYEGFIAFPFPIGNGGFFFGRSEEDRAMNNDLDGDGFSNFLEYAFCTSPESAGEFPTFTFDPIVDQGDVLCTASTKMRPYVGSSLTYEFEYSSDGGVTWTTVVDGALWTVVEGGTPDAPTLEVTNNIVVPGDGSCFLRVRVTKNN